MAELLVESADGTAIAAESHGDGRALVVVSGALFGARLWTSTVQVLARERCVYVMDRRGRGNSGDSPLYAPERELEDILALLRAIPGPLDLLGHSSGALLSLQVAARHPDKLERLIAYEPPVFFDAADRIAEDLPERLDALLAAGQRELAVETFFREGPRTTESDLQAMRSGPAWSQMVSVLAHTLSYDSRVQRAFSLDWADLASVGLPTLMLTGGASPRRMIAGAQTLTARLPNARAVVLDGQQHMAMLTAPAAFAAAVSEFLSPPR